MNERIKELAEQATSIVESPPNREGWTSSYAYFDKEKFAELIVRECAALAKSKSEHIEGIKTEDHDDQAQIHSLAWQFEEFGYEIKKHFGVKE